LRADITGLTEAIDRGVALPPFAVVATDLKPSATRGVTRADIAWGAVRAGQVGRAVTVVVDAVVTDLDLGDRGCVAVLPDPVVTGTFTTMTAVVAFLDVASRALIADTLEVNALKKAVSVARTTVAVADTFDVTLAQPRGHAGVVVRAAGCVAVELIVCVGALPVDTDLARGARRLIGARAARAVACTRAVSGNGGRLTARRQGE